MYKALIFDFADVIHTDIFHAWMTKYGYKREGKLEEASRLCDRGVITLDDFFQKLSEASNQPAQSIQAEFKEFAKVDDQIVDLIKKLRIQYKIALLSNAHTQYLRPLLKKHDLEILFDEIIISSEVHLIKPEPEIFLLILKKLAITADQAIFIDDFEMNTKAAESLGIKSIWYQNSSQLKEVLLKEKIIVL